MLGSHIHRAGFLHRDLKLSNVFLTSREIAKIGDFGLAVREQDPEGALAAGSACEGGTTLYMAPELQGREGGHIGGAADIFALGMCLFELSFRLDTAMERVKLMGSLKDSGALPRELQSGGVSLEILRMVSQNPAVRPTAEELVDLAVSLRRAAEAGGAQEPMQERSKGDLLAEIARLQAALQDRNVMVRSQDETIRRLRAATCRDPEPHLELTPPTPH